MANYLKVYAIRHALSVGFAVLAGVIVDHYFSYSKEGWIILAVFIVSQTTRGTPLKQSISYFFVLVVVAIALSINNMPHLRERVIDTVIGGTLGILFNQFMFPVRIYEEFRLGVVPLLDALIAYAQTFFLSYLRYADNKELIEKKWQIESALDARYGMYPEWVYEVGFNPGLRSGFRFFLVNLERVTEIFFSLSFLADCGLEHELLADFANNLENVMQKNIELLQVLRSYFAENKLNVVTANTDFTSDMLELEKALNRFIPGLELLDVSQDYVTLTALVRDIKDLRGLILQLVMALPVTVEAVKH